MRGQARPQFLGNKGIFESKEHILEDSCLCY